MKRVLILSAPIGSGHKMTANALAEELRTRENVEVVEGDVFSFMPAWIGKTFLFCYLKVLALCPWIYGLAYSSGQSGRGNKHFWLRNLINKVLLCMGKSYLDRVSPDIVLATHATPLGIISLYKKQHPNLFLGAVVPDYNIHHWWQCERINAYFIADILLKDKLAPNQKIFAYGLPIRKEFSLCQRDECRAIYGYKKEEKLILLMGGGEGLLPMESIIDEILTIEKELVKLIVVAGKNEELLQKLQVKYADRDKAKLELCGYRCDIPRLMSAANVLISKGGAVTAAEALATGINYIIYKPLPGQEEGNAKFLQEHYGAYIAKDIADVKRMTKRLLDNRPIENSVDMATQAIYKSASKQIIDQVLREN